MKKIWSLILIMMFTASTFAMGGTDAPSVNAVSAESTDVAAKEFVRKNKFSTIEECMKRVKAAFPKVQPERAKNFCKNAASLANNIDNKQVKGVQQIKARMIADKSQIKARLQNVDDWRVQKINSALRNSATSDKAQKFIHDLPNDKLEVFMHLPRAEQKKIIENGVEDALKKYRLEKVNKENMYKARMVAQEKIKQWEGQYQQARDRLQKANNAHKEKVNKWNQAKLRLREACKDDSESEECQDLTEEAIEKAKEFLHNTVDRIIAHLEQIQSKVEASESISEERVEEILEDIEEKISKLEDLKDEIDAATTKEEIKEIAKKLDRIWKTAKHRAVAYAAHIMNTRVDVIIKKSEILEQKLDCALAELEEAGEETDEISDNIDEFSELVASAKEKWADAKDLYKEIRELKSDEDRDLEKIRELSAEMKELVKDAHEDLREAHKLLVGIYRDIRATGVEIADCRDDDLADDEEYVVVDEEEEESCESDTDCDADETCTEGECEDSEDDSDTCTTDADCDADETCTEGECEDSEDDSDTCTTDADCDADETCENNECEDAVNSTA